MLRGYFSIKTLGVLLVYLKLYGAFGTSKTHNYLFVLLETSRVFCVLHMLRDHLCFFLFLIF